MNRYLLTQKQSLIEDMFQSDAGRVVDHIQIVEQAVICLIIDIQRSFLSHSILKIMISDFQSITFA